MKPKDASVNIDGLEQVVREKLAVMELARAGALSALLQEQMVITSGRDGKHKAGSLHYAGLAVDLRTRDFTDAWVHALKNALGKGWDVVLEPDHIHVEYDPKNVQ